MFRHEGPSRSPLKNAILAGYLALVAGFVNAGGFVIIRSFTSHVTGTIGRIGINVATGDLDAAVFALLMMAAFFVGAVVASLTIESNVFADRGRSYGVALLGEALLLAAFILIAGGSSSSTGSVIDSQAAVLCGAMGMQNSLVTRLSGATIRTTHLTGVTTDLGIELAQWIRMVWEQRRSRSDGHRAVSFVARPKAGKALLLLTIAGAFIVGSLLGAILTLRWSRWAMALPALAILAAAAQALLSSSTDTAE